jgi:hypothetical protein
VSERLQLLGDADLAEELREDWHRGLEDGPSGHAVREAGGVRLHLKWSPFRGRSRVRHALRVTLLRRPLPRLAEFANLEWLRAHDFGAPRPLVAGAVWRGGLPRVQFLATEEVQDTRTLRELLTGDAPADERAAVLDALAREIARLHGAGFVHRDLFPRNLLVGGPGDDPRVLFLDAWRGGPGRGLRGPDYDLGCFFVYAADLLRPEEQRAFLDAYLARAPLAGGNARRFLAAVARHRERQAARARRRNRPGGGLPAPSPNWTPPDREPPDRNR